MNWKIKTQLPIEFEIKKVDNGFKFSELAMTRKIIVIDKTVYALYGNQLPKDAELLIVETTETHKDWNTSLQVLSFFEENNVLRRGEPIVVIGGGVLLDLVGFCCSIYRRGIPYIRVPTTLLAIVDASVGSKTSINYFGRRNRLGSFYPPILTLIDKRFINTQTSREIINGIAEIIKLAIVLDKTLFEQVELVASDLIENKFQDAAGDQIIDRAIAGMLSELNDNLWEHTLQRAVDFGHSFSPIVEMKNVPNLLHGEAVILDCLLSACISVNRQLMIEEDLTRIVNLLKILKLPTVHSDFLNPDLLYSGLCDVMTHRNSNQYLPLPTEIGKHSIVNDVEFKEIVAAVKKLKIINGI